MSDSIPDLLIVGAGVIGLSIADAALRRELKVAILERERAGARASWAGAGMLTCHPWPHHRQQHPDHVDLAIASLRGYEKWTTVLREETEIDPEYVRCGTIELFADDEASRANLERRLEGCAARGVRAERLTRDQVERLEPPLDVRGLGGAVLLEDDAQVRPPRLLRALVFSCRQREAVLREGVAVGEIWIEDGQARGVIGNDGTRFPAKAVVVCAGAWTPSFRALTAAAPGLAKIEPVRGQIACFRLEQRLIKRLISAGEHYLVPRLDGTVLSGTTTEKTGFDAVTTIEAQQDLTNFAQTMVPALRHHESAACWADLRPGLKGTHPRLGPVPGISGLFVASGHYKNGLCLAPITAEIILRLVLGEKPPLPIAPWLPK